MFMCKTKCEKYAIPDPTEAIERSLPAIFKSKTSFKIDVFQKLLCERIPVLEGGEAREDIDANTKEESRRKETSFSRSTSLALRRLAKRRLISFDTKSDYKNPRILDLGDNTGKRVTQIEYRKETDV